MLERMLMPKYQSLIVGRKMCTFPNHWTRVHLVRFSQWNILCLTFYYISHTPTMFARQSNHRVLSFCLSRNAFSFVCTVSSVFPTNYTPFVQPKIHSPQHSAITIAHGLENVCAPSVCDLRINQSQCGHILSTVRILSRVATVCCRDFSRWFCIRRV